MHPARHLADRSPVRCGHSQCSIYLYAPSFSCLVHVPRVLDLVAQGQCQVPVRWSLETRRNLLS